MVSKEKINTQNPALDNLHALTECKKYTYELITEDKLTLYLHRVVRGEGNTNPVLLMHGLTASSGMFTGQEWYNLTTYLLDHGFSDVWILDWRGSMYYNNQYVEKDFNADDVALYDIPLAVATINKACNHKPINIIAHCIGAMTVSMSMAAKQINNINSFICANVGLIPVVTAISQAKVTLLTSFVKNALGKNFLEVNENKMQLNDTDFLLNLATTLGPAECKSQTCRMISFVWGEGHDNTIIHHDHIPEKTHDRLYDYLGATSFSYLLHFRKMIARNAVIKSDEANKKYQALPNNYLDQASNIQTPMLLTIGKENICWQDSIQRYHDFLTEFHPTVAKELFVIPGYGHLDLFMGTNCHHDVFPTFLKFLKKYNNV